MWSDDFEWDDDKAERNRRDHGITFEMARDAFHDAFAVEWLDADRSDGEMRFGLLGMAGHRLLFVAYTLRADRIHIISARRAEPLERRRYHNANRTA